jgi:hypothetical protein
MSGDDGREPAETATAGDSPHEAAGLEHPVLDAAIAELERAAGRLRSHDLSQDEAAGLVEECAELAARVGGELDRTARAASAESPASGQERLL